MAAGLGFKTFTTGEVLTAADTNGYLMQGVLVFASAAARNAAITSPQEGQFAYTKDTNGLWYYDGAAWVASGATGDIEGVTAGVGITGGGTSGTVTITNDMATTITAAGYIVVGTGSGTYDNLPIGTTAQVLTADTTVSPYKVKWATPAGGGGWTLLTSGSLSGTSTVASFTPTGYKQIVAFVKDPNCTTDWYWQIRLNGASTLYNFINSYSSSTTAVTSVSANSTSAFYNDGLVDNGDYNNFAVWTIFDPDNTTTRKIVTGSFGYKDSTATYNASGTLTGQWMDTPAAITSITFIPASTWSAGTYEIYGVK